MTSAILRGLITILITTIMSTKSLPVLSDIYDISHSVLGSGTVSAVCRNDTMRGGFLFRNSTRSPNSLNSSPSSTSSSYSCSGSVSISVFKDPFGDGELTILQEQEKPSRHGASISPIGETSLFTTTTTTITDHDSHSYLEYALLAKSICFLKDEDIRMKNNHKNNSKVVCQCPIFSSPALLSYFPRDAASPKLRRRSNGNHSANNDNNNDKPSPSRVFTVRKTCLDCLSGKGQCPGEAIRRAEGSLLDNILRYRREKEEEKENGEEGEEKMKEDDFIIKPFLKRILSMPGSEQAGLENSNLKKRQEQQQWRQEELTEEEFYRALDIFVRLVLEGFTHSGGYYPILIWKNGDLEMVNEERIV